MVLNILDGCHDCSLRYQNETIIVILNPLWPLCLQLNFLSIQHMVWEVVLFEDFQNGGHSGKA